MNVEHGCLAAVFLLAAACSGSAPATTDTNETEGSGDGDSGDGDGDGDSGDGDGDGDGDPGDGDGDPGDGDGDDTKFDTPSLDTGDGGGDECVVSDDDLDAIGACDDTGPPDSFEPEVEWEWWGPNGDTHSGLAPLVANFTDDDLNGTIDLCDTPDVVVIATSLTQPLTGHLYVIDGATGVTHFAIDAELAWDGTPAIGDIDNDGFVEVIALTVDHAFVAFEHDGTPKWGPVGSVAYGTAIAIADLDADGSPEIFGGDHVLDNQGNVLWTMPGQTLYTATTAADLDDDGALEVIRGYDAYDAQGNVYYDLSGPLGDGFPQVGDLDDDGLPEVLVTTPNGFSIIEHDGTIKPGVQDMTPTGDPTNGNNWRRPATIHDFDGDLLPEFAQSSASHYAVYEPDPVAVLWQANVADLSGLSAGTAFDFLGDGVAEAMYADETQIFVYDGQGTPLLTTPRVSGTMIEYPTVADIDNDGSAEIAFVSYKPPQFPQVQTPTLVVVRDIQDRWIQPRRIWNQHTYHVTNVREDGTIPQHEPKHWESLNTFRTQAQIASGGGVCQPEPEG